MILLDRHIWVWWVGQHPNLTQKMQQTIQTHQLSGLGVSIFSCWEVAKLVELGKLQFTLSTTDWLQQAIAHPGVQLLNLTLPIIIKSTQLPGAFHRDPADQIIVATARVHNIPLLTVDQKILNYPHVQTL